MRKAASSRDLFAKLEDELKKKPIKPGKPASCVPPSAVGTVLQ